MAGPGAAKPARALIYVIAGHHAGLDDWSGLDARLFGGGREDAELELTEAIAGCRDACPELLDLPPSFDLRMACHAIPGLAEGYGEPLAVALWVRMLFSALVDADFLDTEAYFDRGKAFRRDGFAPLSRYQEQVSAHLVSLATRTTHSERMSESVMKARAQVLTRCRAQALRRPGVFTLTVPTGGGKTLASLAFALDHAILNGLRRIIVAIPYTSIVEQTADVFANLFGRDAIVEHHSQADVDDDRRDTPRSRLACENWDAPLVITTNVQLFESLFARRTSSCRKLHNLAGSVIVLDEAQLLPPPFLQPILDVLRLLVKHYGATLVLCTATQPVLTDIHRFDPRQSLRGLPEPVRIVDDEAALYRALERVRIEWPVDWYEPIDLSELATELIDHECVLVIVNTRGDAADLVAAIDRAAQDQDAPDRYSATLHLSAAMCGQHRADVILQIRERLTARRERRDRRVLRVVSTQLVEAGVDIDFPVVFRALAGLDSIAQAAGRCNREGHLGERGGRVVVFVRPVPAPLAALRAGAQATVSVLGNRRPQALEPADFTAYFHQYYAQFQSLDEHGIVALLRGNSDFEFAFKSAAEKFRLIDDEDQASVVVPYVPAGADLNSEPPTVVHLRAMAAGNADRWRLRALQRYVVTARRRELTEALAQGDVHEVLPGWFELTDSLRYDQSLGLILRDRVLDAATLVQ